MKIKKRFFMNCMNCLCVIILNVCGDNKLSCESYIKRVTSDTAYFTHNINQ